MAEDGTVIVSRGNFDQQFMPSSKENYWKLVSDTVQLLGADPNLAKEYREEIEGPGVHPGEKIAVYHTSPLSIALDLAGWSKQVPDSELTEYFRLQSLYEEKKGYSP